MSYIMFKNKINVKNAFSKAISLHSPFISQTFVLPGLDDVNYCSNYPTGLHWYSSSSKKICSKTFVQIIIVLYVIEKYLCSKTLSQVLTEE